MSIDEILKVAKSGQYRYGPDSDLVLRTVIAQHVSEEVAKLNVAAA